MVKEIYEILWRIKEINKQNSNNKKNSIFSNCNEQEEKHRRFKKREKIVINNLIYMNN